MSSIRETVMNYYPHIDRADTAWVLSLFSEDAVYMRADVTYSGLSAIRTFFCHDRQIRGVHLINELWADDKTLTVFATGVFEGVGAAGDARAVRFADIWQFNKKRQVRKRQTYLGLGHAYVER
ncbi:MAG: nuclear transport factor 2 family protein [Pseudomonadota bacterium]